MTPEKEKRLLEIREHCKEPRMSCTCFWHDRMRLERAELLALVDELRAELDAVTRERDEARLWKDVAEARQASLDASRQKIAELEARVRNLVGAVEDDQKEAEQRGFERGVEAAAKIADDERAACFGHDIDGGTSAARHIAATIRQLKPAECSETDSGSLQPVEVKRDG